MTTLAEHTEAHRIAFAEINDLLAGLTDDQLAVQSLCPEWDVKACIAHAIGIEKAVDATAHSAAARADHDVETIEGVAETLCMTNLREFG